MAEDLGNRTEAPTPRRLSDARQRGQVAKSTDLAAAIDLIGAALLLMLMGGLVVRGMHGLMGYVLGGLAGATTVEQVLPVAAHAMAEGAKVLVPFLVVMALIAGVAHVVQVGWLFTLTPLAPKWGRLNPFSGVKNLVGTRNLAKTLLNSMKLALVLAVGGTFIAQVVRQLAVAPAMTAPQAMLLIARLVGELALWLLVVLLALGVADWLYQRWQHRRDLRMTKQDVKDERRSMEGDPQVKAQRFRMAQKIALQRINSAVPKADVVVTNPTHVSVALRYDATSMRAPRVVAKGADEMAHRIRQVAVAHGVPIVERPPLARALYASVPVGREVQPKFYQAVAELLAFVYRLRGKEAA